MTAEERERRHPFGGPDGSEVPVRCLECFDGRYCLCMRDRYLECYGHYFECDNCSGVGYVKPDGSPLIERRTTATYAERNIVSDVVPETSHMIQDDDVREILGKGD
jgi:hypothetical protein